MTRNAAFILFICLGISMIPNIAYAYKCNDCGCPFANAAKTQARSMQENLRTQVRFGLSNTGLVSSPEDVLSNPDLQDRLIGADGLTEAQKQIVKEATIYAANKRIMEYISPNLQFAVTQSIKESSYAAANEAINEFKSENQIYGLARNDPLSGVRNKYTGQRYCNNYTSFRAPQRCQSLQSTSANVNSTVPGALQQGSTPPDLNGLPPELKADLEESYTVQDDEDLQNVSIQLTAQENNQIAQQLQPEMTAAIKDEMKQVLQESYDENPTQFRMNMAQMDLQSKLDAAVERAATRVIQDNIANAVTKALPDYFLDTNDLDFGSYSSEGIGVFNNMDNQLGLFQNWFIRHYTNNVLPALRRMTNQLTAVAMQQMVVVGTFLDAEQQLETQRLFQEKQAEAHKDYQTSTGLCEFGTNVRSLATAERKGDLSAFVLSQRAQDRALGQYGHSAATGPVNDRRARVMAFIGKFCDRNDLNPIKGKENETGFYICSEAARSNGNVNKDIDFTRTLMLPRTLDFDMANPDAADNDAIFQMSDYLYGFDTFTRIPPALLDREGRTQYLDMRSVIAKRSVAENSFNALVALKTKGTDAETSQYMQEILKQLGASDIAEDDLWGEPGSMSYYAQMEVLSKKIYQRPEFYTDLYDTPANVKRKSVAMQAIGLMLQRDIYDSYTRSEMLMSMLLELKTQQEQSKIEAKMEY